MKVWLVFGALVGCPLWAIVLLHFLMQILIRTHVLFLLATFQKLKISFLCTSSFILCPAFFLLWPSCFLNIPHMSCSFLLIPSFFSLTSKNSAFLGSCNKYVLGKLHSIIVGGGWAKNRYSNWLQLAPSNLNIKYYFGELNSIILGGVINQRLGLFKAFKAV